MIKIAIHLYIHITGACLDHDREQKQVCPHLPSTPRGDRVVIVFIYPDLLRQAPVIHITGKCDLLIFGYNTC